MLFLKSNLLYFFELRIDELIEFCSGIVLFIFRKRLKNVDFLFIIEWFCIFYGC